MRICALLLAAGLAACTQFPELDATRSAAVANAPYPDLVPIETLLAGPEPQATEAVIGQVQGRVAGLQAKATRLRGVSAGPQGIAGRVTRLRQKAAGLLAL